MTTMEVFSSAPAPTSPFIFFDPSSLDRPRKTRQPCNEAGSTREAAAVPDPVRDGDLDRLENSTFRAGSQSRSPCPPQLQPDWACDPWVSKGERPVGQPCLEVGPVHPDLWPPAWFPVGHGLHVSESPKAPSPSSSGDSPDNPISIEALDEPPLGRSQFRDPIGDVAEREPTADSENTPSACLGVTGARAARLSEGARGADNANVTFRYRSLPPEGERIGTDGGGEFPESTTVASSTGNPGALDATASAAPGARRVHMGEADGSLGPSPVVSPGKRAERAHDASGQLKPLTPKRRRLLQGRASDDGPLQPSVAVISTQRSRRRRRVPCQELLPATASQSPAASTAAYEAVPKATPASSRAHYPVKIVTHISERHEGTLRVSAIILVDGTAASLHAIKASLAAVASVQDPSTLDVTMRECKAIAPNLILASALQEEPDRAAAAAQDDAADHESDLDTSSEPDYSAEEAQHKAGRRRRLREHWTDKEDRILEKWSPEEQDIGGIWEQLGQRRSKAAIRIRWYQKYKGGRANAARTSGKEF